MTKVEIPEGFYITAAEQREAGIRIHEEIADHTKYRPDTFAQLQERVGRAKNAIDGMEADAKYCISEGYYDRAEMFHQEQVAGQAVLKLWRQRWRDCGGECRT